MATATLSVCQSASISLEPLDRSSPNLCAYIPCGHGSVIPWRLCDTLCTSGFVDDVTFGRNGPYGVFQHRGRSLMSMNALFVMCPCRTLRWDVRRRAVRACARTSPASSSNIGRSVGRTAQELGGISSAITSARSRPARPPPPSSRYFRRACLN